MVMVASGGWAVGVKGRGGGWWDGRYSDHRGVEWVPTYGSRTFDFWLMLRLVDKEVTRCGAPKIVLKANVG